MQARASAWSRESRCFRSHKILLTCERVRLATSGIAESSTTLKKGLSAGGSALASHSEFRSSHPNPMQSRSWQLRSKSQATSQQRVCPSRLAINSRAAPRGEGQRQGPYSLHHDPRSSALTALSFPTSLHAPFPFSTLARTNARGNARACLDRLRMARVRETSIHRRSATLYNLTVTVSSSP